MDVPLSLILDGATGTQLYRAGMPQGTCTEGWILDHPDALIALQREYLAAGSQALCAPTCGANRSLLARFGLEGQVEDYNRRLMALAQSAAEGRALVLGCLTGLGDTPEPFDDLVFEELVAVYAQQVAALAEAGTRLYLAETMTGMRQARAAVLAVGETAQAPIFVTFYCDEDGKTPSGCDVLAALLVMQGMGVSAFGLSCCTPEVTAQQLARLAPYANIPLIAKPAVTEESPAVLASYVRDYAECGVRYFGACCGSTPAHIAALAAAVNDLNLPPFAPQSRDPDVIGAPCEKTARFITPDVDTGDAISCSPNL
ncbi:MAG: homocysteine S-methyltransferase family protein, partial [Oscillospiraceae bacterium]